MENSIPTLLKGHLLMAVPSLADPNFRFTVTCISEHTADGAMGLVVNRLHDDINLEMISQGASEINISCVIEDEHTDRALRVIHNALVR